MLKIFKKYYGYQWLGAIICGLLLPFIGRLLGMSGLHKVIWFYLVINGLYTLYLGYSIRRRGLSPFIMLALPVIFSGISTLALHLVSRQYGFYFGLMYIVLSLFTFFGDTRDDPDENQIPVENGFRDLNSNV
ncbi:hypothetical protein GCM10025879_00680 [Leuconostoc litchii]|uniref:Uncharacterized protein n=1 Tax=Leuconostoc litchii TaxID=1981069 RepID=A0A6P2CRM6_9LACO|nr:hypothetical protein [Leuconostoc litchii]TYC46919.1 hypothetical protein ESZ47_01890 [Leuconostoc litchii]GMA68822.1 hypothetical protein GCM10025879_00680 [Leuconostoc litchii]